MRGEFAKLRGFRIRCRNLLTRGPKDGRRSKLSKRIEFVPLRHRVNKRLSASASTYSRQFLNAASGPNHASQSEIRFDAFTSARSATSMAMPLCIRRHSKPKGPQLKQVRESLRGASVFGKPSVDKSLAFANLVVANRLVNRRYKTSSVKIHVLVA